MATKFITVSVEIMRDPNLNQSQKFLLAEIEQLTTLEKGCIASNLHFSNLIGISKENVSKNINDLEKKGYINTEIVKGSRNHTRIITITTLVRPPYQNSKTPLSKRQETKENKQSNITVNKTISEKSLPEKTIDYLNLKANKRFSYTKGNLKEINLQIKKGHTEQDFAHVIDVKIAEWIDDDEMKKNLNPVTLFREANFDRYLNQDFKKLTMKDALSNGISASDILREKGEWDDDF